MAKKYKSGYRKFGKHKHQFSDELRGTTKQNKGSAYLKRLRKDNYVRITNGRNQDGDRITRVWTRKKN